MDIIKKQCSKCGKPMTFNSLYVSNVGVRIMGSGAFLNKKSPPKADSPQTENIKNQK